MGYHYFTFFEVVFFERQIGPIFRAVCCEQPGTSISLCGRVLLLPFNDKGSECIVEIRFMLFELKNSELLFREEETISQDTHSKIKMRVSISGKYSGSILYDALTDMQVDAVINFLGCPNREAKEEYEVTIDQNIYNVAFIIDTMEGAEVQLEIVISTQLGSEGTSCENAEYDRYLEQLKIKLKDRLKQDWNKCIWIYDEQSECLCTSLYPQIFRIENKIREFLNRALVRCLGPEWIDCWGLEKYKASVSSLSSDFERRVPEFRDIDLAMFSMTLETLSEMLLEGKVYENNIVITRDEMSTLDSVVKSKHPENVIDFLKGERTVLIDIWKDVVSIHLDDPDQFMKAFDQFIKNRNHVAHNKLLTEQAYIKMQTDIEEFATIINNTIENFKYANPSDEEIISRHLQKELEEELAEQPDVVKQQIIREKIEGQTGIKIRNSFEIFDMFCKTISDFCEELADRYYFDVCFGFIERETPLVNTRVKIATIQCNASEDKLDIYATTYVDGTMNGSSSLTFEAFHGESLVYDIVCYYYNGSGYVNNMGDCVVETESVYNDWVLENFKFEIFEYIENDLNPYAKRLFLMEHENAINGGKKLVSDFPCYKCGKQGVSMQGDFYPVGKCCYCGTENENINIQGNE